MLIEKYLERGEDQNEEEGEMAPKKLGGARNRRGGGVGRRERMSGKRLERREKLAQKVGRREKLAQKVGRREIYSLTPPPFIDFGQLQKSIQYVHDLTYIRFCTPTVCRGENQSLNLLEQ